MSTRANEPAYPVPETERWPRSDGLTIREHFAAMAMQGLLANRGEGWLHGDDARVAVAKADALLRELERKP